MITLKILSIVPAGGIPRSNSDSNSLNKESNQEQINFMNFTQQYCIGFIDIINSTKETAKIKDPKKLRKYYSLFLNSMSTILYSTPWKNY